MTKFKVNQEVCIGCGNCVNMCPKCFEIGDDGKSHVILEDCPCDNAQEIKDECPVRAISIIEEKPAEAKVEEAKA